ncbi:MAG: hypothetical protein HY614_01130 [Candidatus Rokubacteria bacterium]|nr:hypothetical protein [Candidatus Rokubacteria bacterium]
MKDRRRWSRMLRVMVPFVAVVVLGACGQSGRKLDVSVAIDFGPAGRPEARKMVAVSSGSTVFEALRTAFPVATSGR